MKANHGPLGRGGMLAKVNAAAIAARSGTHTVICHGCVPNVILRVLNGEQIGTFLSARAA